MLSTRMFGLACAVTVFVCLLAAPASAQRLDRRVLFTANGPISLPGVTLPPGQYIFRLADPTSSSRVVQVLSADGTQQYGLFLTRPAERPEPASTPELQFMENAPEAPAVVQTWWYPGERTGYEFIYPKEQQILLAAAAKMPQGTTQEGQTASSSPSVPTQ